MKKIREKILLKGLLITVTIACGILRGIIFIIDGIRKVFKLERDE